MRLARWITSATAPFLFALATVALALAAEDKLKFDDLPKAVKKTVNAKYPGAKFRGIAKEKKDEGQTVYEVEMTVKGKASTSSSTPRATSRRSRRRSTPTICPRPSWPPPPKNFPKGKITKAEKVTDEDKKVTYEVFIKVGDAEPEEVLMSPEGKIIKPGAKKEKEEDDEKEEKAKKKRPRTEPPIDSPAPETRASAAAPTGAAAGARLHGHPHPGGRGRGPDRRLPGPRAPRGGVHRRARRRRRLRRARPGHRGVGPRPARLVDPRARAAWRSSGGTGRRAATCRSCS